MTSLLIGSKQVDVSAAEVVAKSFSDVMTSYDALSSGSIAPPNVGTKLACSMTTLFMRLYSLAGANAEKLPNPIMGC